MIALQDLCVVERKVKSWMQSDFINSNLNDLDINENTKSFLVEAFKAGFLCPRVEIKDEQVTLNYGADNKYVRFDVNCESTIFTYGTLGNTPKRGTIKDIKKQLKTLSEFVFPVSKVKY